MTTIPSPAPLPRIYVPDDYILISLPLDIDETNEYIYDYFRDIPSPYSDDDIKNFLAWYVEQEGRNAVNAELQLKWASPDSDMGSYNWDFYHYRKYYQFSRDCLHKVQPKHLEKYRQKINEAVERNTPREIIKREGDLPFPLDEEEIQDFLRRNYMDEDDEFTDDDLFDLLNHHVLHDEEHTLTRYEKRQLDYDREVIEKLTAEQIKKYHAIIRPIHEKKKQKKKQKREKHQQGYLDDVFGKGTVSVSDVKEYFFEYLGLEENHEQGVTDEMHDCFLFWLGYDPEEIATWEEKKVEKNSVVLERIINKEYYL